MRAKTERAIIWVAILGILVAGYGLTLHYDDGSSICNINERFDCDIVNKSQWSELFGIPVALLGMLSYALLVLLVLKRRTIQKALDFTAGDFWQYLLTLVAVMFAFQVYLTSIEVFILRTYCLVCIVSQAVVLVLLVLVFGTWRRT